MKPSRRLYLMTGVTALAAVGVILLNRANATPGSGIVTTILTGPTIFDEIDAKSLSEDHQARIKTKELSDVYIVHNRIPPGGHTGWHSHPGISFVTVRAGVVTEYSGEAPASPIQYPAGTGLVEEAGHVHLFANEGNVDVELIAFQLLPLGATRRIDQPAP